MLYNMLTQYNKKGMTPMHMPGHKRNLKLLGNLLPYGIDITEIDGFDNLQDARGVLKETADIAAALYGSRRAFLLINGSTGGNLAAVRSAARHGDTVIMARNCHASIYNAVEINGLNPVYLMPELDEDTGICGSIRPDQVEQALRVHPEAKLVIITSPTYEGVVSDIRGICACAHGQKIPVLVDSAHGAHLGFSGFFPQDAVSCGADIVVMSLHKTLPALTQCALLHVCGSRIDEDRLAQSVSIFQTSSPSYVLLASIDQCVRLLSAGRETLFDAYAGRLKAFKESVKGLGKLKMLCCGADTLPDHRSFFDFDPGKIVISTRGTGFSGQALAGLVRTQYGIEPEMGGLDTVIAMTSVCDSPENFLKLSEAIIDIDNKAEHIDKDARSALSYGLPQKAMPAGKAAELKGAYVPTNEAAGLISLEYIWAYPPGIPFLVPGEVIDGGVIELISRMAENEVALKSTKGRLPSEIFCSDAAGTRF